jgi:hypothetical protein
VLHHAIIIHGKLPVQVKLVIEQDVNIPNDPSDGEVINYAKKSDELIVECALVESWCMCRGFELEGTDDAGASNNPKAMSCRVSL